MSLKEKMSALADAVRNKAELTANLTIDQMTEAVNGLVVNGVEVDARTLSVTPTKEQQTFTSSELGENAYYGTVTVNAIPSAYIATTDATAAAGDILSGKTAYVNGRKVTGTVSTVTAGVSSGNIVTVPKGFIAERQQITIGTKKSAATITPGTADITIPADTYLSGEQIIKGDADLIADNIKKGVSIFGVSGSVDAGTFTADATAVSGDILDDKTAYVNGQKVTGSMTNHGDVVAKVSNALDKWWSTAGYYNSIEVSITPKSLTITPSDTTQTFSAVSDEEDDVFYTHVTVEGIDNLFSHNIKTGVSIAGVEGSFTADATATAADILKGKDAYVNGKRIFGLCNLPTPDVVADGVKFGYRDLNTGKYEFEGTYTSDATAYESDILEGEVAYSHGNRFVGTIRKVEGETVTPGTEDVSTSFNYYLTSPWIVKGDANLKAENIKTGVSIFDVEGTFTSDADAAAGDISEGKTAYVKGEKVTGTASNGAAFYRCTGVYGPEDVIYYVVSGAGTDCNGRYTPGENSKNGVPIYEFTNSSGQKWYMYFLTDEYEGDNWVISDSTDVGWPYGAHYYASSPTSTWYNGEYGEGDAPTVTQEKETINADQEKTWEGKKAVKQDDGAYKYATEITHLTYGNSFRPQVGFIYTADATAQIGRLKMSSKLIDPVLSIPLDSSTSVAESGQMIIQEGAVTFTAVGGVPCAEFNGGYIKTLENSGITGTQSRSFAFLALPSERADTYCNAVGCGNSTANCGLFNCGCKIYGSNINYQFTTWGNDINQYACTNNGRLHHFCYVFDSNEPEKLRIYVDGVKNEHSVSGINTSAAPFFIGRSGAMNGWIYYGFIANVKCYDVAFTDAEVAILYEEMM